MMVIERERDQSRTTPAQWIAGSATMLAATIGFLLTTDATDLRVMTDAADVTAVPHHNAGSPTGGATAQDAGTKPADEGVCFTLNGKTFQWRWPNVPFGALRCTP